MSDPYKILYLDHEGGWGGSACSLYYMLTALDRKKYEPIVWYGKEGPSRERYRKKRIHARENDKVVSFGIPLTRNNWKNVIVTLPRYRHVHKLIDEIKNNSVDLVHFNYEGLFPFAYFFNRVRKIPVVMHIRHLFPLNGYAAWMARHISKAMDHLYFITENERDRFLEMGVDLKRTSHSVVYNTVGNDFLPPLSKKNDREVLKILFLGRIEPARGADRILDIAVLLRDQGVKVEIRMCGEPQPAEKWHFFRTSYLDEIRSQTRSLGISGFVTLDGHVTNTRDVLAESDILIRASRDDAPWGRDVIEAISMGVPVIATGTFDRFVRNGETGFLVGEYSVEAFVEKIRLLSMNRGLLEEMSQNCLKRADSLFRERHSMNQVEAVYERLLAAPTNAKRVPRVGAVFGLQDYERLLQSFLEAGYDVVEYSEAYSRLKDGRDRFVIWRHDIDFSLQRAVEIARLEAKMGVRGDYFVLVRSGMYNLFEPKETSRLKSIEALGHRIGLHFDANLYDDERKEVLRGQIERECQILENHINKPVPSLTFHRPTAPLLEAEISLGVRSHGYEPDFFREMAYFSDSRGTWRRGSPVESKAFAEGRPMQVLTHPIWWTGPAGQTPTERLNDFSDLLLHEIRQHIAADCMTYEYQPATTSTIDKDS